MTNTNCLDNIKCPACGNEESFRIAATTIVTVTDDGTDDPGDMEWDDDSYAECTQCYRHGTLKDFEVIARGSTLNQADAAIAGADATVITPAPTDPVSRAALIPAEAHSDDHVIKIEFDALPWFEQATDQAILALAGCDWGGDYPADEIVYYLDETVPDLSRLIVHLEIIANDPAKKDCRGFECHIDEARALEWLKSHRRFIWAELAGKKPYSVLLLYPDYANDSGTETYYAFVEATDPIAAVVVAQRQAFADQEGVIFPPDDFAPLLVTEGHHASQPLFNR
jgi:hypothetical protein